MVVEQKAELFVYSTYALLERRIAREGTASYSGAPGAGSESP